MQAALTDPLELVLTLQNVFVDEQLQTAVVTGASTGTNQRTGRAYENNFVVIFRFSDGLVNEWFEYVNPIAVMEAAH